MRAAFVAVQAFPLATATAMVLSSMNAGVEEMGARAGRAARTGGVQHGPCGS